MAELSSEGRPAPSCSLEITAFSPASRARNANWTESEELALVQAYERERGILEGKAAGPGGSLFRPSKMGKDAAFERIAAAVARWLFPIIGHMGIATVSGVIRDFAGPYFVSEDCMAFGEPAKYWQLPLEKVPGVNSREIWDRGVHDASEEYKGRMHNLCCDNCHSHVAWALNCMKYNQSSSWNMIKLCFLMAFKGKYVGVGAMVKTWLPFALVMVVIIICVCVLNI